MDLVLSASPSEAMVLAFPLYESAVLLAVGTDLPVDDQALPHHPLYHISRWREKQAVEVPRIVEIDDRTC